MARHTESGRLLVDTLSGPVLGFIDTYPLSERSTANSPGSGDRDPIIKWLGIPYAKAGRWERPSDPDEWKHVLECAEFGPSFPQSPSPFDKLYKDKEGWLSRGFLGYSEDAFTVNVFAPPGERENLPVLVWIYGGNFNTGTANALVHDPTEFVRHQARIGKPVMVVTGNYRVGILGFLATKDLVDVNGHVGNFGLHDCIKIFEWTRKNIAAFGGDPDNVTAMGESAGAFAISMLLHSQRKLFQKAILESGSHMVMSQRKEPFFPVYDKLLESVGVECGSDGSGPKERVEALKRVPVERLVDATSRLYFRGIWGITCDPEDPGWNVSMWHQLERGHYDPWITAAIISINKDEGTIFCEKGKYWQEPSLVDALKTRGVYSQDMMKKFRQLYSQEGLLPDKSNLCKIGGTLFHRKVIAVLPSEPGLMKHPDDQTLLSPLHHFAKSLTSVPNSLSGRKMKVYVCQFETMPQRLFEGNEYLGILHTGEIPFVFNTTSLWDYDENHQDAKTALAIGTKWSSFAQSGDPGWPTYTTEGGEMVVVREGGVFLPANLNELRKEYREFWEPVNSAASSAFI